MGERVLRMYEVRGSNPLISTIQSSRTPEIIAISGVFSCPEPEPLENEGILKDGWCTTQ